MGEALGGHGKRRRNIAPNTGPAGAGLGVKAQGQAVSPKIYGYTYAGNLPHEPVRRLAGCSQGGNVPQQQ